MAVGDGKAQTVEWHNEKLLIWNTPSSEHSFRKHPYFKFWLLALRSLLGIFLILLSYRTLLGFGQSGFSKKIWTWTYWQGEIHWLLTFPYLSQTFFEIAIAEIGFLYLLVKHLQDPRSTEFDLKQRNMTVTTKNLWGRIQTKVFSFDQIELLEVVQHPKTLAKYLEATVLRKKKLEKIFLVGEDSFEVLNAWAEWLRPHLGNRVVTWQAT